MSEIYNLTSLTEYLNNTYTNKKSGKKFKREDVQGYIRRGYLPKYLGDISIIPLYGFPIKMYKLKINKNV